MQGCAQFPIWQEPMTTETPLSELNEHASSYTAPEEAGHGMNKGDKISLFDLLIILAKRKRFIFWITAVFAILATVYSQFLPKSYKATATLLPPQQNVSASAMLASQLGGMAAFAGGLRNSNDMYIGMFKSRTVENAMVQQYGLMQEYHKRYLSDACKAFEGHATVDGSTKDGLIHISFIDGDPRRAAELANGYIEQFRNLSQHLAITEASQRRLFFEQELEQSKNNLVSAEEALKQTEQTTGVIELDSQARALIESGATLRAQIATREVEIQGMQTYAAAENAQLVQAQRELAGLRAQLAKLGGSEESSGGELISSKGQVSQAGLEYIRKLRDVKYNETIFDILARQFEAAKLDEAKQGALIQVVDPAIPPDRKSAPYRGLIVIVATVVGFFIGVFLTLLQAGFQCLKEKPDSTLNLRIHMLWSALSFTRHRNS
jgi:uncharacterized protein involved in exopolysaccharide biosynthesis